MFKVSGSTVEKHIEGFGVQRMVGVNADSSFGIQQMLGFMQNYGFGTQRMGGVK